jgi:hypothetical protein
MVFKTFAMLAAMVVLVAACGVPKPQEAPNKGVVAPAPALPPSGAAAYQIDPAQSELRLLVYRAGPMARLGHNHVIVNRAVGGWVASAASASAASFALRVPVADFSVDDAAARAQEGPDFPDAVSDDAKAGTRRNMLGSALLDADHFPDITLTSIAVKPAAGTQPGHRAVLQVPFTLEDSADRIAASGMVALRQSEMGLTPISVMLGAVQVQDEFTLKFKLVARKS